MDKIAFDSAYAAELAAIQDLQTAEQELRAEWAAVTSEYISIASEFGLPLSVGVCPERLEQLADSLDHLVADGAEFIEAAGALKARRNAAIELGVRSKPKNPTTGKVFTLREAIGFIQGLLAETTAAYELAHRWHHTRVQLERTLGDCANLSPASSIMAVSPEAVLALIDHSLIDPEWEPVRPLLLRLWSERFGWGDAQGGATSRIDQALGSAADDPDQHTENLAFLTRDILQELMAGGSHSLTRHIVLASFRESLARRDAFFFSAIWAFEQAWSVRADVLGERLCRFFSALYQFYLRSQDASLTFAVLGRTDSAVEENASETFATARTRDANETAVRLEESGNWPGLFGRLRFWCMTHYFRPIAPTIRARRRPDVLNHFQILESRFKSGELVNEAIRAVSDRNIRSAHVENIRRYLDDNLDLIRNWLTRTSPQEDSQKDAELADESAPVRWIATQLVRETTKTTGPSSPGSIAWLEREIGHLIVSLRRGDILIPSPVWLSLDESAPQSGPASPARIPPPTHLCSWVAYLEHRLSWRHLLQDQLAEHLLHVKRTLIEAVETLTNAGKLEAALAAAKTADATVPEMGEAVAKIQKLANWRDQCLAEIEALDDTLIALLPGAGVERVTTEALRSDLMLILENLTNGQHGVVQGALENVRDSVHRLEAQIVAGGARRKELETWLRKAGLNVTGELSVPQLESLIKETRDRAAARRVHLLRLKELDTPSTPTTLREAIRNVIQSLDTPDLWPSPENASTAELYIDSFISISSRWWQALEVIDRADVTFGRALAIADLLARELEPEIRALTSSRPETARLFNIITERSKWSLRDFSARVLGLPAETSEGDNAHEAPIVVLDLNVDQSSEYVNEPDAPPILEESTSIQFWSEKLQAAEEGKPGDGHLVEQTFVQFGRGEYASVLQTGPIAWRWLMAQHSTRDLDAITAMFAWASVNLTPEGSDRDRAEALGLVFRASRRLSDRVASLQDSLPRWLTAVIDGIREETVAREALGSAILRLADSQRGSAERERFGIVLRVLIRQMSYSLFGTASVALLTKPRSGQLSCFCFSTWGMTGLYIICLLKRGISASILLLSQH